MNAEVFGVSKDSEKSHRGFMDKQGLAVRLLSDPDKVALAAYGAWGAKTMYGKQVEGTTRSTYLIGPDGAVRAAWPKVAKAAGHAAVVLAELERLHKSQ